MFLQVSVYAQRLHRCRQRIAIEDRVNALHDVGGHIKEMPLVLNRDQRPPCAVIHANLKWLGQGTAGFDIPLDAQISENK
jgi:hypothetical protein